MSLLSIISDFGNSAFGHDVVSTRTWSATETCKYSVRFSKNRSSKRVSIASCRLNRKSSFFEKSVVGGKAHSLGGMRGLLSPYSYLIPTFVPDLGRSGPMAGTAETLLIKQQLVGLNRYWWRAPGITVLSQIANRHQIRRCEMRSANDCFAISKRTLAKDTMNGRSWPKAAFRLSGCPRAAWGQNRKSVAATRMSALGGKAEVDFGRLDFCLCRVGPGNFTPSPSQNRT